MKDFDDLKQKITTLEQYQSKQKNLFDATIGNEPSSINSNDFNYLNLKQNYEHQLDLKNKQITNFRSELDVMMKLLKSLKTTNR
jgi:hypothetical protein